jgi:class 3 adenylate cyclase
MHTGPLLNHAARVKAHAAGGQVLVDSHTWEQVNNVNNTLRADCMGSHQFKGMKEELSIFQVSQEVRPTVRSIHSAMWRCHVGRHYCLGAVQCRD